MSVVLIRTYEVRCDGSPDGEPCPESDGSGLDRDAVLAEAIRSGWLRLGRKIYCPECRTRYEPRRRRPEAARA